MVRKLVNVVIIIIFLGLCSCAKDDETEIPPPIESAGEKVFSQDKKNWETVMGDLDYLMQKQEWDKAEEVIKEALGNFPDKSGELSYYQGVVFFSKGKMDKASEALRKAEGTMPGESLYYLGHVARKKGLFSEALKDYQKAYEYLKNPDFLSSIADLLYENKRNDEAIGYYEKALVAKPDSYLDRYVLANIYFQKGNWIKSEKLLKEALEINRAFRKAYVGLYAIAEKKKDVRASLYYQSRALLLSKNYEKLVEMLEKKEKLVLQDLELAKFYLVGLFKVGVSAKAKVILQKALGRFPQDTDLQVYYGVMLDREGEPAKAMEYFKNLTIKYPDNFNALVAYGDLFFQKEQLKEALVYYERALLLDPSNTSYRYKLAEIYRKQNQMDNEYYHRGILYLYQEQLLQAVESLTRVKNPPYPHFYHFYLGKVYAERGKLDLAEKHYREAIALKKDMVGPYLELAYVYVKKNEKAKALEILRAYPGVNPEIKSLQQFIDKL